MYKTLGILALNVICFYCGAQDLRNRAPVEVRKTERTLVWPLDFYWLNFATTVSNVVQYALTNSYTNSGTIQASNFVFTYPRWTDVVVSSSAFGKANNLPNDEIVSPGSEIYGKAFDHGDDFTFSIQTIHDLAETNALFPNFYFEPHIHISTSAHTSGTNATFRLELQVARVWGVFTNAIYRRTNTLTLTNLYQHGILSFGEITNNDLSGRSSVVFRGFMERIDGGAGDIGNTHVVFADSADIHIPFKQHGSASQKGD